MDSGSDTQTPATPDEIRSRIRSEHAQISAQLARVEALTEPGSFAQLGSRFEKLNGGAELTLFVNLGDHEDNWKWLQGELGSASGSVTLHRTWEDAKGFADGTALNEEGRAFRLDLERRLARGMAFHFAFGWLFVINGAIYAAYLALSGEWR